MGRASGNALAWGLLLAFVIVISLLIGIRLIVSRAARHSENLISKATAISDIAIEKGLGEVHFEWLTTMSSAKDESGSFENSRNLVHSIFKSSAPGAKTVPELNIRIFRWPLSRQDKQKLSDKEKLWIDGLKIKEGTQLGEMSELDGSGVVRKIVPIPATSECINCHKDLNRRNNIQPNETIGVAFVEVLN